MHTAENKAEIDNGDSIHGDANHRAKDKAKTKNGDPLHNNPNHGAKNEADTSIGDSLHGNGHRRGGYFYPQVNPRLEEVHDDGINSAEHRCRAFLSTTPQRDEQG